jgi:hypothetical protein
MLMLLWVSLATLGSAALAPQDEAVRLWVEPSPDWAQTYRMTTRLSMVTEEREGTLKQDADIRLVFASVEENGSAVLRATVERIKVEADASGEQRAFAHPKAEGEEKPDEVLSAMYGALLEAVLEFHIDAEGKLTFSSGLDRALNAADEALPDGQQYLGIFVPGSLERTVSYLLTLDPDRSPRRVEEAWTYAYVTPVFAAREARIAVEYILRSVEDGVASVSGDVDVSLVPREVTRPGSPVLEIAEQFGNITARWDAKAGRLISRSAHSRIVWSARVAAEPPIESTATITMQMNLALVSEPVPAVDPEPEEAP